MKLTTINTGLFKLDGGAMFGVVPKSIWAKLCVPDDENMCTWAMRCLLVQNGNRNILIDTGLGNKQDEKFRSHFSPHGTDDLVSSLAQADLAPADITDVFLTHLHFDHCGGALVRKENGTVVPQFPYARHWSHRRHYDWALTPNARERASFLKENFVPLDEQELISWADLWWPNKTAHDTPYVIQEMPLFEVLTVFGHTEAMMLPIIRVPGAAGTKTVVYCADLVPSEHHVGAPYVMGYDVRPLDTMKEKEFLLSRAADEGWVLVFEHSASTEAGTVKRDANGRIVLDKTGTLAALLV